VRFFGDTVLVMDVAAASQQVLGELVLAGDPRRAAHDRAYLKSSATHLGVSVPHARRIVAGLGRRIGRDDLIGLVTGLWSAGPYDAKLAASLLLDRHASVLGADDLVPLEAWLREAGTWSLVDLLAPRPLDAIDNDSPDATTAVLDGWIADPDFWLRRAALLAHLIPLRTSLHRWDRFAGYAEQVLPDREFFVRKATGWVLREVARHDPQVVRDWLMPRSQAISSVALREAVRALPGIMQGEVMAARAGAGTSEL
jgi:3-methyladenine DNA glycosylase AlkD